MRLVVSVSSRKRAPIFNCIGIQVFGVQVEVLLKEESTYKRSARLRRAVRFSPRIYLIRLRTSWQMGTITLLSNITILISIDHCRNVKTTISLLLPSIPETALNSGKVTKPLKMANFDAQKSECEARRKKSFPESILTPTFCKKRGPNWSNFASVGPFVFYIQL